MEFEMNEFDLSQEGATAVKVYDEIYINKPAAEIQIYPDEMVVRFVRGKLKRNGYLNVLDAGCGEGRNALMMLKEGLTVTCLDTSQSALDLAKSQAAELGFDLPCVKNSITKTRFAENSFDAIICWRLLYYVTDIEAEQAMKEFLRILKPGGYLYLSVPSEFYTYSEIYPDDGHLRIKGDNGINGRVYRESELPQLFAGYSDLQYGLQGQSFLGQAYSMQSYWHALARKQGA